MCTVVVGIIKAPYFSVYRINYDISIVFLLGNVYWVLKWVAFLFYPYTFQLIII